MVPLDVCMAENVAELQEAMAAIDWRRGRRSDGNPER
jgi:hypothetical protein